MHKSQLLLVGKEVKRAREMEQLPLPPHHSRFSLRNPWSIVLYTPIILVIEGTPLPSLMCRERGFISLDTDPPFYYSLIETDGVRSDTMICEEFH